MSFDINAIINNAIAQAIHNAIAPFNERINELTLRINELEDANTILADLCNKQKLRIDEETVRLSLNHDKLVERVSETNIKLKALDMLVLNGPKYSGIADPTTGMDYSQRDALTQAFIEKLDNQEWFWDKINAHIESTLERLGDGSVTVDSFPELFATQWQRKVGSNDLLGRDEVAEIVKELWTEDYEPEVCDIAERTVDNYDFEDTIRQALRDYDFSDAVESVLEDYDLSSKIEDVLEDFDMDSKIENGIDSYDFDFESKIRDVLRNARIDISL